MFSGILSLETHWFILNPILLRFDISCPFCNTSALVQVMVCWHMDNKLLHKLMLIFVFFPLFCTCIHIHFLAYKHLFILRSLISHIITTWRGITCRIAVTIEGFENSYLPRNVHFEYRPYGDIGVTVVTGAIRNASRWLDERITWCPLFGGVLSQVRAQAREDLSTRSWLKNRIWD